MVGRARPAAPRRRSRYGRVDADRGGGRGGELRSRFRQRLGVRRGMVPAHDGGPGSRPAQLRTGPPSAGRAAAGSQRASTVGQPDGRRSPDHGEQDLGSGPPIRARGARGPGVGAGRRRGGRRARPDRIRRTGPLPDRLPWHGSAVEVHPAAGCCAPWGDQQAGVFHWVLADAQPFDAPVPGPGRPHHPSSPTASFAPPQIVMQVVVQQLGGTGHPDPAAVAAGSRGGVTQIGGTPTPDESDRWDVGHG